MVHGIMHACQNNCSWYIEGDVQLTQAESDEEGIGKINKYLVEHSLYFRHQKEYYSLWYVILSLFHATQVNWNEPWLWGLAGFHATTFVSIIITRGRPYLQAAIFCLLGIYLQTVVGCVT